MTVEHSTENYIQLVPFHTGSMGLTFILTLLEIQNFESFAILTYWHLEFVNKRLRQLTAAFTCHLVALLDLLYNSVME